MKAVVLTKSQQLVVYTTDERSAVQFKPRHATQSQNT